MKTILRYHTSSHCGNLIYVFCGTVGSFAETKIAETEENKALIDSLDLIDDDCKELIEASKAQAVLLLNRGDKNMNKPIITHTYLLAEIDEAYELFENKRDGLIKVAVEC